MTPEHHHHILFYSPSLARLTVPVEPFFKPRPYVAVTDGHTCSQCGNLTKIERYSPAKNHLVKVVRTICSCSCVVAFESSLDYDKVKPRSTMSALFDTMTFAEYAASLKQARLESQNKEVQL